jgi:hypothetical protein
LHTIFSLSTNTPPVTSGVDLPKNYYHARSAYRIPGITSTKKRNKRLNKKILTRVVFVIRCIKSKMIFNANMEGEIWIRKHWQR